MALFADRSTAGTIGGGSGEADVIARAADAMSGGEDRPSRMALEMWADENSPGGMVCGGRMEILLDPLFAGRDRGWLHALLDEIENDRAAALVRRFVDEDGTLRPVEAVFDEKGDAVWRADSPGKAIRAPENVTNGDSPVERIRSDDGGADLLVQRFTPAERLIIVGGGHIAVSLCELASRLGFRVVVLDDRPEYASPERFPDAVTCRAGAYAALLADLGESRSDYYALVSRGYAVDVEALRVILTRKRTYVGMIGSRRRVKTVKRVLTKEGIDAARFDSLCAPIGIDIEAETPAEIAVSIAAQIIAVRHGAKQGDQRRTGDRKTLPSG